MVCAHRGCLTVSDRQRDCIEDSSSYLLLVPVSCGSCTHLQRLQANAHRVYGLTE